MPSSSMSTILFTFVLAGVICGVKGHLTWKLQHAGVTSAPSTETNVTTTAAPVTEVNPPGRGDAVMGYDGVRQKLIIFGGMPGPMGDTWIYNITKKEWREVTSAGPPARYAAVGGVSGDYFYVATGKGYNDTYYSDVWRFSLVNETWEELPPMLSHTVGPNSTEVPYSVTPRFYASGGIYNTGSNNTGSNLYVTMGIEHYRKSQNTYSFDVEGQMWYREDFDCVIYDPRCPHPRHLQSGIMTGPFEFVIFAGCLSGDWTAGPCPSHDTWRYNGQSGKWTQLDSCPQARVLSTMALLPESDGKRYVLLYGGEANYDKVIQFEDLTDDEVAILDLDSGSWTRRVTSPVSDPTQIPLKRTSAVMATGPDGIFLFGGVVRHGIFANDLWLLEGNATSADNAQGLPCSKITTTWITVHGILMVIGFGFFLPLGALLMRYFQCIYVHIIFQIIGLCCAIPAFALAIATVMAPTHFSFVHAIVGITAMALVVLQPFNALLRPRKPHPHETESICLVIWRFVHRFGGRSGILLGLANMTLGIFLAVSVLPIVIAWHVWVGFLLLLVVVGEFVRNLVRPRRRSNLKKGGNSGSMDGIINGWEKGDNYVNPSTESVRL